MEEQVTPVTFQATIGGLNVRNLASLDKSIKFSVEVVEPDDIRLKVAQFLMFQPSDQTFQVTICPVNE